MINNQKREIKMNPAEIYKLASEITEKEIQNVLDSWEVSMETKQIETFESLVRLGDSRSLALITTISEKYKNQNTEMYELAYYS